ncbi:glycosyltransferase family 2 protein [Patescibacteria group bacterium]
MKISVVIVTRNRSAKINKCINCLLKQTIKPAELVIIDSSDNIKTKVLVQEYNKGSKIKFKYKRIAHVSIPYARNQGISTASHELIAFTDDDCHPLKNWTKSILESFNSHKKAVIIGGKVANFNTRNYWAIVCLNMMNSYFKFQNKVHLETFLFTNNLALKKDYVIKDKIKFDERLLGIEDVDLCKRAAKKGHIVLYDPSIIVKHDFRDTFKGFLTQWFFYGRANYRFYKKYNYNILTSSIKEYLSFIKAVNIQLKFGFLLGRSFWLMGLLYEALIL